jgi:hypothetical protein
MQASPRASLIACVGVAGASAKAAETPDPVSVIRKLDLSSFANSTGPRRVPGKRTPEQYGFTKIEARNGVAYLTEPDGEWSLSLWLIGQQPGHVLVCFEDQALNGGAYDAESVLDLSLDADELYKAKERPATAACPARPGQG